MKFYYSQANEKRFINAVAEADKILDLHNWSILGDYESYEQVLESLFPLGLYDENGIANYKSLSAKIVERTIEEKQQELNNTQTINPSVKERLDALEQAMLSLIVGGV